LTDEKAPGPEPTAVHLHPRAVPAGHAFAWYEEAMRLWKRSPAMWGALAVATLAVALLLEALPGAGTLVGKFVTPLVAAGMVVASFAADRGEPVRMIHVVAAFFAPAGAIASIVAASVVTFIGEAATAWWIADVNLLVHEGDYGTLSVAAIVGIYIVGVLVSLPFTFVPFHVLLERADPVAAFAASFRAFSLNTLPLMIYGAVSLVLLAFGLLTFLVGFVVALPLWVAASYAAWKDIFGVRVEIITPAE
jgi:uncharacterized membrane protein